MRKAVKIMLSLALILHSPLEITHLLWMRYRPNRLSLVIKTLLRIFSRDIGMNKSRLSGQVEIRMKQIQEHMAILLR